MPSFTQRLTKTLRLDALARTLQFTATGCCPDCRLIQPVVHSSCVAGCDARPRKIAAGDEDFFEPIPASLELIPEDPKRLRYIRIDIGMLGYFAVGAFLVHSVIVRGRLDLLPYAIGAASTLPIAVAIIPKVSRKPPTVSGKLAGKPELAQLPPVSGDKWTGTATSVGKRVRRFLGDEECIACQLDVVNARGELILRGRRSQTFQLSSEQDEVTIVKGPLELVGEARVRTAEVSDSLVKQLGLKAVDLDGVQWLERVIDDGTRVTAHGPRRRAQLSELAAYRDQLMDLVESEHGTTIEISGS